MLLEAGNQELTITTTISDRDKQCNSTAIEFTCNELTVVVDVELYNANYVARLTGLSPFRKFNCSARVTNEIGWSESTDVQVFSTKQDGKIMMEFMHAVLHNFFCYFRSASAN